MKRARSSIPEVEIEWGRQLFEYIIAEYRNRTDTTRVTHFLKVVNDLCKDYRLETNFFLFAEESNTSDAEIKNFEIRINDCCDEYKSEEFLVDLINLIASYEVEDVELPRLNIINHTLASRYSRIRLIPTVDFPGYYAALLSKHHKK